MSTAVQIQRRIDRATADLKRHTAAAERAMIAIQDACTRRHDAEVDLYVLRAAQALRKK